LTTEDVIDLKYGSQNLTLWYPGDYRQWDEQAQRTTHWKC